MDARDVLHVLPMPISKSKQHFQITNRKFASRSLGFQVIECPLRQRINSVCLLDLLITNSFSNLKSTRQPIRKLPIRTPLLLHARLLHQDTGKSPGDTGFLCKLPNRPPLCNRLGKERQSTVTRWRPRNSFQNGGTIWHSRTIFDRARFRNRPRIYVTRPLAPSCLFEPQNAEKRRSVTDLSRIVSNSFAKTAATCNE